MDTEKKPKDHLQAIFRDIADGEIKKINLSEVNVSSLRTRAAQLNAEAGYTQYRVSVDNLYGLVRISNNIQ
ncbi:MAG: hypothetical protein NC344_07750 [Bacteroidales bacterium]|nr:hypothetical protein [Bacteroidales bacterium]MCM1147707.1 hypothetical protein [Bacteroidales bacterium]MCM1206764.1 hypothetical protein [Bacillota bacterium]MCM1510664.1 hypothetical protein [Clostridium sp.]